MASARHLQAGVLWLLCAGGAAAADKPDKGELFKCVDATGATSIQSAPCAKGSTQVWRRDAAPEAPPTPEQQAAADARRERDQRTVRELSDEVERKLKPTPAPPPAPAAAPEPKREAADEAPGEASQRCAQAQAFAGQLRDKDWLALSEEQWRRIYGWVAGECQAGPPAR